MPGERGDAKRLLKKNFLGICTSELVMAAVRGLLMAAGAIAYENKIKNFCAQRRLGRF